MIMKWGENSLNNNIFFYISSAIYTISFIIEPEDFEAPDEASFLTLLETIDVWLQISIKRYTR
jgi:hypothetical protein